MRTLILNLSIIIGIALIDCDLKDGKFLGSKATISIIEKLESPIDVIDWDEQGLNLVDGRHVPVPGFSKIPLNSSALKEATKRGVEISKDRNIYCLVKNWHWCGSGSGPIVEDHIVRVDLSLLLSFLREGERVAPVDFPEQLSIEMGGSFSENGWRYPEILSFFYYCHLLGKSLDESNFNPYKATPR